MRAVRLLAIFIAGLAVPAVAGVVVVARSGDAASDGFHLDAVGTPVSSAAGLTFSAGSSLLAIGRNGTRSVVVRTGDRLPPPHTGTWNQFVAADANDMGAVAVTATMNATSVTSALFLFDGRTVIPVASGVTGRPVLNNAGQIAYLGEAAEPLFLWSRASGVSARIIGNGDPTRDDNTFLYVHGTPLLNASGVVAFRGQEDKRRQGIFLFKDGVLTQVAGERRGAEVRVRLDRRGIAAMALNDAGDLAFVSGLTRSNYAVWLRRAAGTPIEIANDSDRAGSQRIDDIVPDELDIDDTGAVTFRARFRGGGSGRVRAADGTLTPVTLPDRTPTPPADLGPVEPGFRTTVFDSSTSGAFVVGLRRESIYRLTDTRPEPLMDIGGTLSDGRRLASISAHVFVGDSLVFLGRDDGYRTFVGARRADGTLHTLAATDEPGVDGRPFGVLRSLQATDDGGVMFLSESTVTGPGGIFRADPRTGAVESVYTFSSGEDGPIEAAYSFVPAPGGIVVDGVSGEKRGLFVRSGEAIRRLVPIARHPRPGRIGSISAVAADDGHIAFWATLGRNGRRSALFSHDGRVLRRILVTPRRAPGGGRYGTFFGNPLAAQRREVAFLATVHRSTGGVGALFLAGPRRVRRLLADGDHVDDGVVQLGGDLVFANQGIVVTGALRGRALSALLAVTP